MRSDSSCTASTRHATSSGFSLPPSPSPRFATSPCVPNSPSILLTSSLTFSFAAPIATPSLGTSHFGSKFPCIATRPGPPATLSRTATRSTPRSTVSTSKPPDAARSPRVSKAAPRAKPMMGTEGCRRRSSEATESMAGSAKSCQCGSVTCIAMASKSCTQSAPASICAERNSATVSARSERIARDSAGWSASHVVAISVFFFDDPPRR
mmetsp:Transcript_11042/g.27819  ORF Transcript_11042/g.27819 Transcript_11042/m.27819 type:complete len:209 (+) Transcript_11042:288-914(+)